MCVEYLGSKDLLDMQKTAFLCSRKVDSTAVLRCFDWATEQRGMSGCVISGFHSQIEKEVLHFLLRCKVPVIMVLGRKMYQSLPEDLGEALSEGLLLIISTSTSPRQSTLTAQTRNRYILEHADRVVIGSLDPHGSLAPMVEEAQARGKRISILTNR